MTTDVFIPNDQKNQCSEPVKHALAREPIHRLDPLGGFELDRSSLSTLVEVIDALEDNKMFDEANLIADNLADYQQIRKFAHTLFKHADDGFVQLRMFIDDKDRGDRGSLYGYPWRAVHVGDLDKLAEIATQAASYAAHSPEKVNFCPPVATFTGTDKATQDDLCQGLVIILELDEKPDQSRRTLEALIGPPTVVVKSGGKWQDQDRCHAYWRLSKPVSGNDVRLKQCRTWASDLVSSDPTGKPINHPLRWPGSWHKKGEPRLCRISEINETVEIDFEFAYTTLKEAAAMAGLRVEQEEVRPRQEQPTYKADADWHMGKPGPQAILATYRSKTCNRRSALVGFASGIAMSALHAGYDLSIGELTGIVEDAHRANPSTSKRTGKELTAIAEAAQDWAHEHVSVPAYLKKDAWEAWLISETERIERDLREADEEAEKDGDSFAGDDELDEPPRLVEPSPISQEPVKPPQADAQEPIDIFGSLSPKPVLTPDMLPEKISDFAFDAAARMGADPAALAVSALVVCSAAITDEVLISPKRNDPTWTESARLWAAIIGEPGTMKTPAMNEAVRPLVAVEQQWRTEDAKALAAYEQAHDDYQFQKNEYDRNRRKGQETGDSAPEEPEQPPRRRAVVNDTTMEALALILVDNPRGVLLHYDELMGFIGGLDAYRGNGAKKDRPTALQLWNGGYRAVDRVGTIENPIMVQNLSGCFLGGIQPDKLAKLAPTLSDDGLLQRFLLVSIDVIGQGEDRHPNLDALATYNMLVDSLANWKPSGLPPIRLSEGAQEFRKNVEDLAFALKTLPGVSPALQGHADKIRGLFARLLLTMHAIECSPYFRINEVDIVSAEIARRAHDLMVKFFIPHAVKVYEAHFGSSNQLGQDARWIAGHILAHNLYKISYRDCQRAKREFEDRPRLERAIETLIAANWLDESDRMYAKEWTVNLRVHEFFAEQAERERQDRADKQARIIKSRSHIDRTYSQKS